MSFIAEEYHCTSLNVWEEFVDSFPWKDVVDLLHERIEDQHRILEDVDDLKGMGFRQGYIAACRDILEFPDKAMSDITMENENAKRQEEGRQSYS